MANNIDKVKILILGDSGVGKTCFTHLIAHNETLTRPGWTVGCNIEVRLHEYKESTPQQRTCFIEFFDIGGSLSHKNTRNVFYTPTHGIILVHDLTNRKSHDNLREWLYEVLNKEGKDTCKAGAGLTSATNATESTVFDPEQFMGSTQIPILVVGTKLDLIDDKRQSKGAVQKTGGIAEQCGAEEIWLSCSNQRSLAAGTTDAVKLTRFFDRVIEKRVRCGEHITYPGIDRRRYAPTPSPLTSPEASLLSFNTALPEHKSSTPKMGANVLLDSGGLQ